MIMTPPKISKIVFALLGVVLVYFLALTGTAHAAYTWYVKPGGNDSSPCTSPANACATINGALRKPSLLPGDIIKVAKGTYVDSGPQVVLLDKSVVLSGGWDATFMNQVGTSKIDGQRMRRGVFVNSQIVATLDHFTVLNGTDRVSGEGWGAGIKNLGTLTITESSIIKNNASKHNNGGYGAGIYSTGQLTLTNSLISKNIAFSGGGGIYAAGAVTIRDSTISQNRIGDPNTLATHGGAGIWVNYATVTLENSTVSGNTIQGDFLGSAIDIANSSVTLNNTTLSDNLGPHEAISISQSTLNINESTLSNPTPYGIHLNFATVNLKHSILAHHSIADCELNTLATNTFTSLGYSVVENAGNCTPDSTDVTGTDPLLGGLADNGGPTLTRALLPGSPAIELLPPGACPPPNTDQRGAPRPVDDDQSGTANCDAGAFEYGATAPCIELPHQPQLQSPANRASTHKHSVLLVWNFVWCADTYNVVVRANSKHGPPAAQVTGLLGTQYKTNALPAGTFFWRVEACNNTFGCSASKWRTFSITASVSALPQLARRADTRKK